MYRIAILVFPGSNCEGESAAAIRRAGMEPVECLWNQPTGSLRDYDGFFLVGGFSYEDRSRAGVIASLDPVIGVLREAAAAGKPVLGICNGAQILVESGLVPGIGAVAASLAENRREVDGHLVGTGFYNVWCTLGMTVPPESTAFTRCLPPASRFEVPLAHAEGRFVFPAGLVEHLDTNEQTPFRYVNADGVADPAFPVNPNGSCANLAAITNPGGNVMAMMPHPERTPSGDGIFRSMRDYLEAGCPVRETEAPPFELPRRDIGEWVPDDRSQFLPVNLIITDNTAASVENALRLRGIAVAVERQVVWSLDFEPGIPIDRALEAVDTSGVLYNSNKEYVADDILSPAEAHQITLVVENDDDIQGLRRFEELRDHFSIPGLHDVRRSVVWRLTFPDVPDSEAIDDLIRTHIFHNPVSDSIYRYHP